MKDQSASNGEAERSLAPSRPSSESAWETRDGVNLGGRLAFLSSR